MASSEQLASAALMFTFVEFIMPALVGCLLLSSFLKSLALSPVAPKKNLISHEKARSTCTGEGPNS
jgi:hypothetical protein